MRGRRVLVLGIVVVLVSTVIALLVRASVPAVPTPDGPTPVAGAARRDSPGTEPETLLAAGDIADCSAGARRTGALLDHLPGIVAALGDLAYPDGSAASFRSCYDPAWGRVRDRTRPAQGNHDVRTPGAAGYYAYFGEAAGPRPQGYYSYDLGTWHIVVLNSNCEQVGGCDAGSPQLTWLRRDLSTTRADNILAYWHHPRFSTGQHGDDDRSAAFWRTLYDAGADIILGGHDHDYQRFTRLDPDGRQDPRGIRQFVVGTGGAGLRDFSRPSPATLDLRQNSSHGILRLDLGACGYRWTFLAADGPDVVDKGSTSGTC